MNIKLTHGLAYGEEIQFDVVLRELTTNDILQAQLAAEKLVFDKQGNPHLVNSPTLFSYEVLRRQIAKVGVINGPLSMEQMKKLHPEDIEIINAYLTAIDTAKAQQVIERGRLDATGSNIGEELSVAG